MKAPLYNQQGEEVGTYELPARIFGVVFRPETVRHALFVQEANARQAVAHTKIRKEVRGGGRKPWRQKGTGRARHGSIRSPLWKGGGVTFGPRGEKNFALKINKKQRQKALFMVLSSKHKDAQLAVLDNLRAEKGKTKEMSAMLDAVSKAAFHSSGGKKTLVILPPAPEDTRNTMRSLKNIPHAKTVRADSMNIRDLLAHRFIIMPRDAIGVMEKTYVKIQKSKLKNQNE